MTQSENFSAELKQIRDRHGLTQAEMAVALDLSPSFMHQLEAGKRTAAPSTILLVRLWDRHETARKNAAGTSTLREQGTGFTANTVPFPLNDESLSRRVDNLASIYRIPRELIMHSAVAEYVTRAERDKTITLQMQDRRDEDDPKTKGAA